MSQPRIIIVNTGDKFDEWYTDNLIYMCEKWSGLNGYYEIIRDEKFEGVFNKFQMFDRFRSGQNIYFDLDILIKGDVTHLLRKDFTVCHAWWRDEWHTPINSSVISWEGDMSSISDKFFEDPEYHMLKYRNKCPETKDGDGGMDEFISTQFTYQTYKKEDGICSIQTIDRELDQFPVYLFNQRYKDLPKNLWYRKFLLLPPKPLQQF